MRSFDIPRGYEFLLNDAQRTRERIVIFHNAQSGNSHPREDDAPLIHGTYSYEALLPPFSENGRKLRRLSTVLQEFVRDSKEPPVFLDLGFGYGTALVDARKIFGSKIHPIGYGFTSHLSPADLQNLRYHGVDIVEGDIIDVAHRMRELDIQPHIITACSVMPLINVRWPRWDLLRQFSETLQLGGYGFINQFDAREEYIRAGGAEPYFKDVIRQNLGLEPGNAECSSFQKVDKVKLSVS